MIDINALPLKTGAWCRRPGWGSYENSEHNGQVAMVKSEEHIISFGTYTPCGANIGKAEVHSNEDVVTVLQSFQSLREVFLKRQECDSFTIKWKKNG